MTELTTQNPESQVSAGDAPAAQPDTGNDLSWIGQDFHTDGRPDVGRFREHYETLLAEDARRREAPAAPADGRYDLSLPANLDLGNFALPEGQAIQLLTDDPNYAPVFEELQAFMHANGLSQQTASGLMGMLAKYQAAQTALQHKALTAEYEKLGPTPAARDARLSSIRRSLASRLPQNQAQAVMAAMQSAEAIQGLDALLTRSTGPMAAPPQPQKQVLAGLSGSDLLRAARGM
jgi:hypothetical protein